MKIIDEFSFTVPGVPQQKRSPKLGTLKGRAVAFKDKRNNRNMGRVEVEGLMKVKDARMTREEWVKSLKVGSEVYYHSGYSANGFAITKITGETSRSWLAGCEWKPDKHPKKTAAGLYSAEDVERLLWMRKNGYLISHRVSRLTRLEDYDTLKAIEKILEDGK
ncbi:MAG: hypothetical protein KKB38_20550 [Gammaproteobacteria bacterium]|nr:hypothetical protein [Gammaproteobacteria bacterium]